MNSLPQFVLKVTHGLEKLLTSKRLEKLYKGYNIKEFQIGWYNMVYGTINCQYIASNKQVFLFFFSYR